MTDSTKNQPQRWLWAGLLLVLLLTGIFRFRLLGLALERDEGEFAYGGQLMLQGIPPYQLAYFMKLPGTHAIYALMMAVFGQSPLGIHLGLWLMNAATVLMMFRLGSRWIDPVGGLVAATSYALLSTSAYVFGFQAHATHFVVFFALAGLLTLLRASESRRWPGCFFSGVLLSFGALMKQPGLFFALFGALLLAWFEWRNRPADWRVSVRRGLLFLGGGLLPVALTCLILNASGVFDRFWFWTVTNTIAYGSVVPLAAGWQNFLDHFTTSPGAAGFWLLTGAGLGALVFNRQEGDKKWLLLVLAVFSLLAASMGLYFRRHYFILLLPAASLMIAAGLGVARRALLATRLPRLCGLLPAFLFALATVALIWAQRGYLFYFTGPQAAEAVYHGNPFAEAREIARFIDAGTAPASRIAVLGSEPEIYFYAHRHSATGYIYTYDMMSGNPAAKTMQLDMIREIEASRPEMIVFVKLVYSWDVTEQSETLIMDWAAQYCRDFYDLIGVVDFKDPVPRPLHSGAAIASYSLAQGDCVFILKRKTPKE